MEPPFSRTSTAAAPPRGHRRCRPDRRCPRGIGTPRTSIGATPSCCPAKPPHRTTPTYSPSYCHLAARTDATMYTRRWAGSPCGLLSTRAVRLDDGRAYAGPTSWRCFWHRSGPGGIDQAERPADRVVGSQNRPPLTGKEDLASPALARGGRWPTFLAARRTSAGLVGLRRGREAEGEGGSIGDSRSVRVAPRRSSAGVGSSL
jgi:hypothetical protein